MKNLLMIMVAAILVGGCVPSKEKVRMRANKSDCVEIRGVGDTTLVLEIDKPYRGLSVSGNWEVELTDGVSQPMLVVDKELLKYLKVRVRDEKLELGYTRSVKFRNKGVGKPRLRMSYDQKIDEMELSGATLLRSEEMIETQRLSIETSGASTVMLKGLNVSELDLDMSGASDVEIENLLVSGEMGVDMSGNSMLKVRGKANLFEADMSGASELRTAEVDGKYDFVAESAEVEMSGSTEVVLHCDGRLDVEASGASRVRYSGEPMLSQEVSGAADVLRN